MKKIATLLLFLTITSTALAASNDILAKNIQTNVVQKSSAYTTVSIRLEAMNYAEPAKVYIRYRALDFSGYELTSGLVSDSFQKYDSKVLTDTTLVRNDVYNRIHKWEIGQISAYPGQ